jgi:hypothetical protein
MANGSGACDNASKKEHGITGMRRHGCVLPTEDDGNPMVDKRIARCARVAQISQTFLVQKVILRKS